VEALLMATKINGKNFQRKLSKAPPRVSAIIRKNKKCRSQNATRQPENINSIFENQKILSNANIILDTDQDSGAISTSHSILNSMGISVENNVDVSVDYSITGNTNLDIKKLETLTKTQDFNPNRTQDKKFSNLKTTKVKASDLFEQSSFNSIFELDDCVTPSIAYKPKQQTNVIKVTNELLRNMVISPGNPDLIGGFKDTSLIQDPELGRDSNVQTTGTGRGTTGAQGDGRGGVDNAFGSGVINRGGSY
jgi:putative NADH-flavin reductase